MSPEVGGALIGELGADEVEHDILSDLSESEPEPETVMVGAGEGLGGPSWQEPGSMEVSGDVEQRGPEPGERDVPAAFLTGAVLAIAAIAALLIGDWLFGVLAAAIVLLAQGELFGVMVKHHRQPATAVGLVAGALMLAAGYFRGEAAVLAMFALGVAATFLWFMSGPVAARKDVTANIGLTCSNMAWMPLLGSYLLVLLEGDSGTSLVVSVIGLTFVYDTAAFLSGSVWGGQFFQRPLAPTVSPKKSIEGVIIGTLVTVVVAVTLVTSFVDLFEDQRVRGAPARPRDRCRGDVRRPRGVAREARHGHQGHGQHPARARRGARPHRLAAVRGARGVLPLPHHRGLSTRPPGTPRRSERSARLGVVLSA